MQLFDTLKFKFCVQKIDFVYQNPALVCIWCFILISFLFDYLVFYLLFYPFSIAFHFIAFMIATALLALYQFSLHSRFIFRLLNKFHELVSHCVCIFLTCRIRYVFVVAISASKLAVNYSVVG